MKLRVVIASFLVALILVSTVLISYAEEPKLKKIVVAEAARSEYWLPVYLAHELGYYKDEGLDVSFVTYKDGPIAAMGLIAGDAQFCVIGLEPVLKLYDQGKKTKVLLTTTKRQPYGFATSSGIKKIKDLKGKRIFSGMPASAPYAFATAVLKNAGLNPEKDVTFVSMQYGAELAALQRGEIDGCYIRLSREPEYKKLGANILVDASVPAQHKKIYKSDKYEAFVVQVASDFVKKDPESVQKFTNAVLRAIKWQNTHTSKEIAAKVSPLFPGRVIDARLITIVKRSLSADGYFTVDGYKAVEGFCKEIKLITKPVPFKGMVDHSFLNKAHKKYGK